MFFDSLSLGNFGPFKSVECTFRPGVNVIVGQNGSGKSQLIGAISAALIGRPAVRINKDGAGPSTVDVIVREGDTAERLSLFVSLNNRGDAKVQQHSDGKQGERGVLGLRLLAAWSNPTAPRLLLSDGAMQVQFPDLQADDFEAIIPDTLKCSQEWSQFRASGVIEGATSSARQIAIGVLLRELARRSRSRETLPLFVDGYFERIAAEHVAFAAKVLQCIAETSQVILLARRQPPVGVENTIYLEPRVTEVRSLAYYNYLIEQQRPRLKSPPKAKWVRGAIFPLPESRTCELKEVKGNNPTSTRLAL